MNKIIFAVFLSSLWNLSINQADRMKPATCEAGEVCHIDLLSIAMCTCPGQKPCSKDFVKEIRGVEYQFCESMDHLPNCSKGEVYSVHKGIRQILKCLCPFPMEQQPIAYNVVEGWIKYKCDEPKMCSKGDTCRVRKRVPGVGGQIDSTLLINQCRCRPGSLCLEVDRGQKRRYRRAVDSALRPRSGKFGHRKFDAFDRRDPEAKLLSLEKMFKSHARASDDVKRSLDDVEDDFETPPNDKLLRWTFNDGRTPPDNDDAGQATSDRRVETIDEPFLCVSDLGDEGDNFDVR